MSIPIKQLSEVAIVVTDLDRSVKFYHEVLGLPIWERTPERATMRLGNGFVGLWLPGTWTLDRPGNAEPLRLEGGCRQHFNFWVERKDCAAAVENLKRHGVTFYGPRVTERNEIHIDFEDPDGHLLEYWGRDTFDPVPEKEDY